ncbi:MAG TPA: DUF1330 domain-containing protein [Acidimicrobiales bacterium]|nr:DUF1330 domain-containing protein [Acidimicrobiales bacterium]
MAVTPTREQFETFANDQRKGEVVMINLLHFAPAEGAGTSGGADAYRQYGEAAVKMVEARGGRVVWMGRPEHVVIGDPQHDQWDLAVLVSYPSRQAFVDMVTTSEYQGVHRDRERGLDRSVLLACEPIGDWMASRA